MMKRILLFILTISLVVSGGSAQPVFPENGQLFVDNVVPRIDITVNPDTLAWIYANPSSDREFHAIFVFDNGVVRDTVDPVGFRLRGNTSRMVKKEVVQGFIQHLHSRRKVLRCREAEPQRRAQ